MTLRETNEVVALPTCGVRPEVLTALKTLSSTTGLSVSYLTRSFIEQHLSDLGLLPPAELTPTKASRKDRK